MGAKRSRLFKNASRPAARRKRKATLAELLTAGEEPNEEQDALLDERGEAIYLSHEAELERRHGGNVVAIEIESGKLYVGENLGEAAERALAAHPGRVFYFRVIGPVTRSRLSGSSRLSG